MTYTAFLNHTKIISGSLLEVTLKAKDYANQSIFVFNDSTGQFIDLDLRGSKEEITARLEEKLVVGRPKLGVIAKEITLLPKHWQWLLVQGTGASATIRKLIDQAMKSEVGIQNEAQHATHTFMTAMTGHLEGYEEALRALYAKDALVFHGIINRWEGDISNYVKQLSAPIFTFSLAPSS